MVSNSRLHLFWLSFRTGINNTTRCIHSTAKSSISCASSGK
uniref:Uncharacterized protein n=1 Tax=Arundo donax TaxID=35708 RepID=A0A0A9BQV5_ARUDO